jgi:hypothetical protein
MNAKKKVANSMYLTPGENMGPRTEKVMSFGAGILMGADMNELESGEWHIQVMEGKCKIRT